MLLLQYKMMSVNKLNVFNVLGACIRAHADIALSYIRFW